jgi:hypothetical protein
MLGRRTPETLMKDLSSIPIGDFENTLSFPGEETSLGSGLPSHLSMGDVPCPSSPSHGFLHHTIRTLNNLMRIHDIKAAVMLFLPKSK